MSFADIIQNEQKKLEQGGSGEKVKYPETKHKRLFFEKNQPQMLLQVLPAKDLVSAFAEPTRKIFLSAKSSGGKDINSNFTLDAESNAGSLLEQKVVEWSQKGMIPNGFGGQQSPKRVFLVNAVKVIQNPANPQQWVQERDAQGNLVVRTFDMPQSAYQNLLRKLGDPMYNVSGTELSFMDINKPSPIKISKPAKGQMEYPVEVYSTIVMPPLGQGWENQLEDLKAQAVPTERLENGYDWVQAFVDMKEGRKPSRGNTEGTAPAPQTNPYANMQQSPNPYASAPQTNPYANMQQAPNPYANTQQPNPYGMGATPDPYANVQQPNMYANVPQQPMPAAPVSPNVITGNTDIGTEVDLNMPLGLQNMPTAPQYTAQNIPVAPVTQVTHPTLAAHNVDVNGNGLMDIDAMLARELNGGN